ncbi:MAG: hypothetical protein R3D58_13005 [Saprospiraceae bacterium]
MLIVSFSGGRTSAYMAYRLQFDPVYAQIEKRYVFANTGKELEETLLFVNECDNRWGLNITWIEALVNPVHGQGTRYRKVSFETASRNGEPFSDVIAKYGLPGKDAPLCSKELKTRPISKWAKDNFGTDYQMAIGIRIDERSRQKPDKYKVYPLIDWFPTWELMVRSFWAKMDFDLGLKDYEGNCDLCWKKSLRKRMTLISERPGIETQWEAWEKADGEYTFDRDGFTIGQIREMAAGKFNSAKDKFELCQLQPTLFGLSEGIDVDKEAKCMCF